MILLKINAKSLPMVTSIGRYKQSKMWKSNVRVNERNVIILIIDGSAIFELSGQKQILKRGDIVTIVAKERYDFYTSHGVEYLFVNFDADAERNFSLTEKDVLVAKQHEYADTNLEKFRLLKTDYNIYLPDHFSLNGNCDEVLNDFMRCFNLKNIRLINNRLRMDCKFCEALMKISNICFGVTSEKGSAPPIYIEIMRYIEQNFTKPITLSDLAKRFKISKTYILTLFKKNQDMTVTQYINYRKLTYAQELLIETTMNVSEIADYLGFQSVNYFCRLFKKNFKMTPTEYASRRMRN